MPDPAAILARGVAEGRHLGAQLCVMLDGKTIIDSACGEARPGVPLRTEAILPWFSSGKPLTALALAQLYEQGALDPHDPVSRFIPKFATNGKGEITLWHLLTHTAGLVQADALPPAAGWAEMIRQICATPAEPGWTPGEKAGYSAQAAWFLLGEVIQRITRVPVQDYLRSQLFEPLGMHDSWLSPAPAQRARCVGRIAPMFDTSRGLPSAPSGEPANPALVRPGSGACGPARELARLYAMLLEGGELEGRRIVRPETVRLFTARHREGLFDHTFRHTLDFGLGFILNSSRYGPETVPYGYGRHASEETFGHSGVQSSCAFADPDRRLAAAWIANGRPGERLHQQRQREVNSAIYQQLGLAS